VRARHTKHSVSAHLNPWPRHDASHASREINITASPFYERLGFVRFEAESLELFVPLATVREMLGITEEQRQAG
jgi:hypothetical protein